MHNELKKKIDTQIYLFFALLLTTATTLGCTSDADKMKLIIEPRISKCKAAEGYFAELNIQRGSDEVKEVMKKACQEPISDIKVVDDFNGELKTGPYVWYFTKSDDLGWSNTNVEWKHLRSARHALQIDKPSTDDLQRALKNLTEAHKEWPKSEWVALKRLHTALDLRKKTRTGKDENLTHMGPEAEAVLNETIQWANDTQLPSVAKRAQLLAAEYYLQQKKLYSDSLEKLGNADEWLQAAIQRSQAEKDKKKEAEYVAELEERRAKRPSVIKEERTKIYLVATQLCKHFNAAKKISADNLDIKDITNSSDVEASISAQFSCSDDDLNQLKELSEMKVEDIAANS